MKHPIAILSQTVQDKQPATLATEVEVNGASFAAGVQIILLEDVIYRLRTKRIATGTPFPPAAAAYGRKV